MKKLLCAILCLTMLLSVFLVPAGATNVDVSSDSVAWNDTSCLKYTTLHNSYGSGVHKMVFSTGTVKEDSTVTFWVKYDAATATVQRSFPFLLTNKVAAASGAAFDNNTEVVAKIESGPYTGSKFEGDSTNYYGLNLSVGDSGYAHAMPGVWHRIDMVVDFTNSTMTAYIDYNRIGSMALANADNGYAALCIPNNGVNKPEKSIYFDNLMITKGAKAPSRGDLASNLNVETLKANKNSILFFDNYDALSNVASGAVGTFWNPAGGWALCTTDGVAQQDNVQFRGVQQSAVDGTYNIRFVGTVDSANYNSVGFKIALKGGKTINDYAVNVYDSIIGANGIDETVTYSAIGTYGAGYIYASTINGLSATGTYEFTVTPFTVDESGVETAYASYTVSCVNGVVTATAAN